MSGGQLRAGDVLLLTASDHLTLEQCERMRAEIKSRLPGLADVLVVVGISGAVVVEREARRAYGQGGAL